jgi:hypothetical protein
VTKEAIVCVGRVELPPPPPEARTSLIAATTEDLSVVVNPERFPVPEPVINVLIVLNSVATRVAKDETCDAKLIRVTQSQKQLQSSWCDRP